jgi:hypothetical protein
MRKNNLNKIKDVFNCRACCREYNEYKEDKSWKTQNGYLRYLGFCSPVCLNFLPKKLQQRVFIEPYFSGELKKINHRSSCLRKAKKSKKIMERYTKLFAIKEDPDVHVDEAEPTINEI